MEKYCIYNGIFFFSPVLYAKERPKRLSGTRPEDSAQTVMVVLLDTVQVPVIGPQEASIEVIKSSILSWQSMHFG